MARLADNVLYVTMFYASGADEDSLEPAENALTELLMERFEQDEDAFSIVDQSEIMEAMPGVTNTMSLMIGVILVCIRLTRQHPGSLLMRFGIPAKKKL